MDGCVSCDARQALSSTCHKHLSCLQHLSRLPRTQMTLRFSRASTSLMRM
jgi:hypothetical protein